MTLKDFIRIECRANPACQNGGEGGGLKNSWKVPRTAGLPARDFFEFFQTLVLGGGGALADSLASRAAKGTATLTELVERTTLGEPPPEFTEFQRAKWGEIAAELERLGVADSSLRFVLKRVCEDLALIEQCNKEIAEHGLIMRVQGPRGRTMTMGNPASTVLSAAGSRLQASLASLGLTVASQSKIRPKPSDDELIKDPFAKFD